MGSLLFGDQFSSSILPVEVFGQAGAGEVLDQICVENLVVETLKLLDALGHGLSLS